MTPANDMNDTVMYEQKLLSSKWHIFLKPVRISDGTGQKLAPLSTHFIMAIKCVSCFKGNMEVSQGPPDPTTPPDTLFWWAVFVWLRWYSTGVTTS